MTSISRQFGKLTTKSAANETAVAVLISDYEDANKVLQKIIDATNQWCEAWRNILAVQLAIVTEYDELYGPITGAGDTYTGQEPLLTPELQLERTQKLRQAYQELKDEMLHEINSVESRIVAPATTAKDYLQPLRKTLKSREHKKLDFERYQDRVFAAHKKMKKTQKDHASLARYEQDLAKATEDFRHADIRLRESFPPLLAAVFSLFPHLLAAQILVQNTLLGQYYTILHEYCEAHAFPSPPPPMADVVSQWTRDFGPAMKEVEGLAIISRGRAVHTHMGSTLENYDQRRPSGTRSLSAPRPPPSIGNSRPSSPGLLPNGRVPRIPTVHEQPPSPTPPSPSPPREPSPVPLARLPTTPSPYSTFGAPPPPSAYVAHSPAGPHIDYFSRGRQQSSSTLSEAATPAAGAFKKKAPPPPPPKKRADSGPQVAFVTAIYSFEGTTAGDLSFREGDRIRVVTKTESKDDWWEGELRGTRGSFPANYCA